MLEWVQLHWKFIVVALILQAIGRFMKSKVWKAANDRWWVRLGYRTMPLHPVIGGMLIGLLPGLDGPWSKTVVDDMLYFGAAGVCATWVYATVKQWFKR